MTSAITTTDLRLSAHDGFSLAASRYEPATTLADLPITIISSAAAVPRGYYGPFAKALAARGRTVYTYDYRGVGGSLDKPVAAFETTMRAWGQLDARGVLDQVAALHPGRPIHWIGHSYGGGFAVGLNPSNGLIARHLGVAVPHGYYREMDGLDRVKVGLLMGVGVPLAVATLGYLPGKRLGFGENLPKGAALEWRAWIMSRNSMWDTIPAAELVPYTSFKAPMAFIRLTDDPWASEVATTRMAAAFPAAAETSVIRLGPADSGGQAIGHMGFFRSRFAETLWPKAFEWLNAATAAHI
jgi:predicted alpha/beta hydrolase